MPTPEPKLTYVLQTEPSPVTVSPSAERPAVVTLNLLATNPHPSSVLLDAVIIELTVGPNADQLISTTTSIRPEPPTGWQCAVLPATASVQFVFTPTDTRRRWPVTTEEPLLFRLFELHPNTKLGTAPVLVHEGSVGEDEDLPIERLAISKFPVDWGAIYFRGTPLPIATGSDARLEWSGPPNAAYELLYYDYAAGHAVKLPLASNQGAYPGPGNPPLRPAQTTTYTLLVRTSIGGQPFTAQAQATVTVLVPAPRIVEFRVEPSLVREGEPRPEAFWLIWKTEYVETLHISELPDPKGNEIAQGRRRVNPKKSNWYTATANGLPNAPHSPAIADTSVVFPQAINMPPGGKVALSSGRVLLTTRKVVAQTYMSDDLVCTNYHHLFELAPDFLIAEPGELSHHPTLTNPDYNTIVNASYRGAMANNLYCTEYERKNKYNDQHKYYTEHFKPNYTWFFKDTYMNRDTYGVLWLQMVSGQDPNPVFKFNWMPYDEDYLAATAAAAPAPEA